MYLVFMGACVTILLSLGVEWSSEMDNSTSDYEKYLSNNVGKSGEFGQEIFGMLRVGIKSYS